MEKALPGVAAPGGSFLDGFARLNAALSAAAQAVALAAVMAMVLITCIDVLGAKLFLRPLPGSLDMMMMAQLIGVSFAGAAALLEGRHVAVEFFVALLPERPRAALVAAVNLTCLLLFIVVAWRLFAHGAELQSSHEVTPTAGFPVAPFAYAAALAMVPLCLVLLQHFLQDIDRLRHES